MGYVSPAAEPPLCGQPTRDVENSAAAKKPLCGMPTAESWSHMRQSCMQLNGRGPVSRQLTPRCRTRGRSARRLRGLTRRRRCAQHTNSLLPQPAPSWSCKQAAYATLPNQRSISTKTERADATKALRPAHELATASTCTMSFCCDTQWPDVLHD